MAKTNYKLKAAGAELHATDDDQVLLVSELASQLTGVQGLRALDDATRELLAGCGIPSLGIPAGFPDLASFDAALDDEYNRIADLNDYVNYSNTVINTTVLDGAWVSPEALESVSDENVGAEGVLSIDGTNSTWWQSDLAGTRIGVWRLRDYKKRVTKIRLRSTSGDLRAQVQDVTIRGANTIPNLDTNVVDTGVDFTHAGTDWIEHTFTSPKTMKYLGLDIPGSLNANDQIRVREVELFTITANHEK